MAKGGYSGLGEPFAPDTGGNNPCLIQVNNQQYAENTTN
jgi:hypothetical protein